MKIVILPSGEGTGCDSCYPQKQTIITKKALITGITGKMALALALAMAITTYNFFSYSTTFECGTSFVEE